ncbi:hypothetical protein ACX8Z9_14480 [Arthrobacter halodurans]|uniref:Uncharacterized protein n=1 Tax=Arthrobacter halodurans TaxID=516699 RepID=A0ABV4UKW3_9MICC
MKPILSLALAGVIAVGGGLVAVGAEPLVEAFSHTPIIEVVPEPATPQELADLVIIETEIPGSGEQVPCSELLPEERGNC